MFPFMMLYTEVVFVNVRCSNVDVDDDEGDDGAGEWW